MECIMKISRSLGAFFLCVICLFALAACGPMTEPAAVAASAPPRPKVNPATIDPKNLETATFAGGCFWSMQRMMDEVPGVITTTVGYSGGTVANPTYEQVSSETTGHAESVQVVFDTAEITYTTLVMDYWHMIDPTQVDQQACD